MSLSALHEVVDHEGCRHVPDPELVAIGERILELFCELRPRYTPGRVRVGRKALPHFYKAAELCRARGATPEQFVEEQLRGMAMTGSFWPSAIACRRFRDRLSPELITNTVTTWMYKSMLQIFTERGRIYGPRQVLEDETVQLSVLFRAVMAHHHGLHDLVDDLREAARVELESTPVAKDIFKDLAGFL